MIFTILNSRSEFAREYFAGQVNLILPPKNVTTDSFTVDAHDHGFQVPVIQGHHENGRGYEAAVERAYAALVLVDEFGGLPEVPLRPLIQPRMMMIVRPEGILKTAVPHAEADEQERVRNGRREEHRQRPGHQAHIKLPSYLRLVDAIVAFNGVGFAIVNFFYSDEGIALILLSRCFAVSCSAIGPGLLIKLSVEYLYVINLEAERHPIHKQPAANMPKQIASE